MRLLNASTLEFKVFENEDEIPDYAILSHTWEAEEVSYQDMTLHRNESKTKRGFRKIKNMAQKTLDSGFEWFWVDTCNIDKSSSAELSEAINCELLQSVGRELGANSRMTPSHV
jgi:hypothetical protein